MSNRSSSPTLATAPCATSIEHGVARAIWTRWFVFAPSLWLWVSLCVALAPEWSTNPQYSHGWFVPLLSGVIAWERWRSRPSAKPEARLRSWWMGVVVLGVLAYLPLRWLEEANPEWRLLLWIHGCVAIAVTSAQVAMSGGRRWLCFFAFAILWPAIAIPWPTGLENFVVQQLTRAASTLTAEIANITGIPAFQQGNVIEIRSGVVGIEEACSGIRSLQAALLGSLFLGALFALSAGKRWLLVGLSIAFAFATNVARTYTLVYVAHHRGLKEAEHAHDSVATVAMIVALGGLFAAAKWMERRSTRSDIIPRQVEENRGLASLGRGLRTGHAAWIVVWMLGATIAVEVWYRSFESTLTSHSRFWVDESKMEGAVTSIGIPGKTRAMLRYGDAKALAWQESNGDAWRLYWLRWDPGRNSAQLARAHTPEVCLTGTGGQILNRWSDQSFPAAGLDLVFDQYAFKFGQREMHVFYCLWQDRIPASFGGLARDSRDEDGSAQSRIRAAWAGRRNLGQTVIEVAVVGPRDPDEARASLGRQLAKWITRSDISRPVSQTSQ